MEDNGIGMPEPVRARIFEPFSPLKEVGQGTGLGPVRLPISSSPNNHKGQLEVPILPGQGTCFTPAPAADRT